MSCWNGKAQQWCYKHRKGWSQINNESTWWRKCLKYQMLSIEKFREGPPIFLASSVSTLPVKSSPIVLITCLPYIQSPTDIPKPPNKRIDGGVLPTWDTCPSVQISQIAMSGPIALDTSLPPCVNAPKHAVKIFPDGHFQILNRINNAEYWPSL